MRGVNLLPAAYQKLQRQERYRKRALFGLGGLYLLSLLVMGMPYGKLMAQKEQLKAITYQLQDTRFDEVKLLTEKKAALEQQIQTGEAQIRSLAEGELPLEELLYNVLYGLPADMHISLVSIEREGRTLVLEGTSRHRTDITNRLRRIQSIYPQGKVDFVVEASGEAGYLFQMILTLGEGDADGDD